MGAMLQGRKSVVVYDWSGSVDLLLHCDVLTACVLAVVEYGCGLFSKIKQSTLILNSSARTQTERITQCSNNAYVNITRYKLK